MASSSRLDLFDQVIDLFEQRKEVEALQVIDLIDQGKEVEALQVIDLIEDLPTPTSLPSSSSSSASPPNLKWTYDVFLSFRGEDTRNNFADHLYMNLTQRGIHTFRDEERLERGKEISPELLKAIEGSRFAIIIFSENYASSSWCLDELVKIIDCTKETGQIAYPVFYNLDPSNVRKQEGSFAKAFAKHEKKNVALERMEKWRKALSHEGGISGWDTRNRSEAKIIQEIVEGIFYKLSRGLLHVDDNLVGMEIHMMEIYTRLNTGSNDVNFVGIHGLGGIGKTTIAKVIYNQISYQFEGCSYLANVRGEYEKEGKLVSLQNQLFRDILKVEVQIGDEDSGSSVIEKMLKNKKVLIILDDVAHENQLKKLAGNDKWFGPGSRIIITTRDQRLLSKYEGVQRYEVRECDQDKSLEIFSWKAFKQNYPPEDYMELSNEVVHYAKGLPLALTVLGSHLHDRSEDAWRGAIKELKIIPNKEITEILEISYKGLDKTQKDVFLDIACFFNGEDKDEVMEFGLFPSNIVPVLIEKSLITVSTKNELMMHDLVRDMGRHIVYQESPKNPGKRSRLWNIADIRQALKKNRATKAIEGIQLYWSFRDEAEAFMHDWRFKAEAFMEMDNLRFLKWEYYPCEHLVLDFPHDKLVHLSLRGSSIKSLWNGRQGLPHLKSIDLSFSEHLREFPDVTELPKLERLSLSDCSQLVKIHPSVWVHKGLKYLDLGHCYNLGSFPNKIEMESLETLDLSGTKIKELPSSIENSIALKILDLVWCSNLVCLPNNICKLKYLEQLDLTGCSALEKLPENIRDLKSSVMLDASSSASTSKLKSLPSSSSSSSSSSASPPNLKWTYDVFLSFRGEDTRKNFVDHLFMKLTEKGINTFRDDEKLERGKEISGDLLKAIEESRFAIIFFFENYASSSWCLDELVKIIDCTKETGQIAYPVFYNLDPSNVRKQVGSFAKAFDEHEKKNLALEKMEKWKKALSQAGNLSGWDTRNRHEAKIIQEIVEKILDKLRHALLHVDDHLVGMENRMEDINTHLNLGSNDVKFVGIHGLGGIGKTTTAKVIYNQISYQFEGCSYLKNVRGSDLVSLQNQLLYDILKVDMKISNDDNRSFAIQSKLNNQKVLIILDDVDDVNQLEKLAGNGKWFGPGSRIVITTRDQHLLNIYNEVQKYEVKECDRDKSLEIFSWKAFKQNCPPEHCKELSNEVVRYAQGLPLALTVLGSHLRGRSKDAWRGAIDQLSIIPNKDINDILKISYEGLEELQKNVFLDIACFFNGEDKDKVMEKLDGFGFFPSINIQVLIDKSLITVSAKNELLMHDLVRDMGQHIVRQESPENPGKWSRLWNTKDIRQVLENNKATEAIKGIKTNVCVSGWSFEADAFMKMKNLRFLEWYNYPCEHLALDYPHDKLVHLSLRNSSIELLWNGRKADLPRLKSIDLSESERLREFPDVSGLPKLERLRLRFCTGLVEIHPSVWVHKGLKFLHLGHCYNLVGSFPNKIEMESLETLSLRKSSIKSLWNGRQADLPHLKSIDLTGSWHLREFPDVTRLPKLEELSLPGCKKLVEIHPSVWVHKGLKFLDLNGCINLVGSFPNKIEMDSLETFDLGCCFQMEEFPEVHGNNMKRLSKLVLSCTEIKELPSSIENFTPLKILNLDYCDNLVCLPSSICKLKYLEQLKLCDCSALEKLPENIGDIKSLVKLDASYTAIKEVPSSIQFLVKLRILSFDGCNCLKLPSFNGLPSSLTELDLSHCDLTDETFPINIECLPSLETLGLSGNYFKSLPTNITQLPLLTRLNLSYCRMLESVPKFPSRISIDTDGCTTLIRRNEDLDPMENFRKQMERL